MAVSTILANGSSIVAWQTIDGLDFQRVDSSGIPLGAPISTGNGPAIWTSIASLSNGGFTLIWDATATSSPIAQNYDANGIAVGADYAFAGTPPTVPLVDASALLPVSVTTGTNTAASTTLLPNGDRVVVTTNNPGINGQLQAQQFDPNGNPVGPAFSESFGGIGGLSDIETTALAGGAYLVTYKLESNYSSTLYADLFRADGTHLPEQAVATASGLVLMGAHGSVALPDGGYVLTWIAPPTGGSTVSPPPLEVYTQEFRADGSAAISAKVLDILPPNSTMPETVVSANGTYTISWTPGGKGTPEAFTFTEQGAATADYSNDAVFTPAPSYTLPAGPHSLTLVGSGPQTVTANNLGDIIVSNDAASTLIGGQGSDILVAGHGANVLTGGAGADTFTFNALPWNAGQITDFTSGSDKIDVSALLKSVNYAGSDPFGDHTLTLKSDGHGGTDLMYNPPGAGSNGIWPTTMTDIDNVAPSALNIGADFVTGYSATTGGGTGGTEGGGTGGGTGSGGTGSGAGGTGAGGTGVGGSGDGGGSGPMLTADNSPGEVLAASAPSATFYAGQNSVVMTEDGGANCFVYNALPWNAGQITNFNPAQDTIDVSAMLKAAGYSGTDPFGDHTLALKSDGHGGTDLIYNPPGAGANGIWPITVVDIDNVAATSLNTSAAFITIPGASGSTGTGSGTGSGGTTSTGSGTTLTANDTAGQLLTAVTPSDTFIAGHNSVVMTGDGGSNVYVFNALPWNAGEIANFNPASDTIDVSGILAGANYTGTNPLADGTFTLNSDGHGGTELIYHPPGAGANGIWPISVVDVAHITASQFQASDWIFHH